MLINSSKKDWAMSKNNRVDIYAGAINKYNGGSDVSESYVTGKKREILQLQNLSFELEIFP